MLASLAARGLGDRRLRLTLQGNRPLHETLWARIDTAAQIGQRFYVPSSYPAEWSFSTAPAIIYRPSSRFSLTVRGQWMQQKGYAYKGVPVLRGELLGDYDAYLGNKDSTCEYSSGMAQLEAVGRLNRHVSLHAAASYMHTSLDYVCRRGAGDCQDPEAHRRALLVLVRDAADDPLLVRQWSDALRRAG